MRGALLLLALGAVACGPILPPPRTCRNADVREGALVSTPPPPGQVEIIPPVPKGLRHPVWVDGEQEWSGRRWVWKPGGWRDQAPDECYAPPASKVLPDGKLLHAPGIWKKDEPPPH